MNIAIGSDHRGFVIKNFLKKWLHESGHKVVDVGTDDPGSADYTDYALEVGKLVALEKTGLGILICGTGIGMSMAANKVKGVRAARVCTVKDVEMTKRHNNANVLCFGADTGVDEGLAKAMVTAWMEAEFEGGRHQRRVAKISKFEDER
ncbi:ribose 5-phosphate isomerase B [candidate division WOR-3 bacterium]|nr:ribose 5-phosphate isomerase B [candidate division WOR-3 bacterium]